MIAYYRMRLIDQLLERTMGLFTEYDKKIIRRNFRIIVSVIWTILVTVGLIMYPGDSLLVYIGIIACWAVNEVVFFSF